MTTLRGDSMSGGRLRAKKAGLALAEERPRGPACDGGSFQATASLSAP